MQQTCRRIYIERCADDNEYIRLFYISDSCLNLRHRLSEPDNKRTQLKPEEYDVKMGDKAGDGTQLRPFIVWFGEADVYPPASGLSDTPLLLSVHNAANLPQDIH